MNANNKLSKKIAIFSFTIVFSSFTFLFTNIYATHISEPILSIDKDAQYNLNETIPINGWIKYNEKPASDVLVLVKLVNPNGKDIYQEQIRSDQTGNFSSNINLIGSNVTEGGTFTLYAESQCRDEHRNICTHKNNSHTIVVIN